MSEMNNQWRVANGREAWLPWLGAGIGVALLPVMLRWLKAVAVLGQNIPQHDLVSDYVVSMVWAVFLGLILLVWPRPEREKKILLCLWVVKCFVVLVFMLFYEAHYDALDTYDYFESGVSREAPVISFIGDGTQNVAYLAWLHNLVMPGSFHGLKVTWAFIGLMAIFILYKAASMYLGRPAYGFLWCLGLFPSVLFWSSIFGKEPLALLGISAYIYGVIGWDRQRKRKFLWAIGLGMLLAVMIRLWLGPVLLFPLFVLVLRDSALTHRSKIAGVVLALALMGVFVFSLRDRFGIEYAEDVFAKADTISQSWATGGSGQELPFSIDSPGSMVRFLPIGAFAALFRPLPGDVPGAFGLLAGLENLALLALVIWGLTRVRRRDLKDSIFWWAILLIGCWTAEYAIVSYQNLGAAVRFKLQILPILIGLSLHLVSRAKEPASGLVAAQTQ